jgi:uncharacterized protein DUF6644
MTYSVQAFSDWLAGTPLSMQIKTVDWIIPTVQTIHILSISMVMSAAAMVDLRVLGLLSRRQPLAAVSCRFVPWIWWTLIVLLLSGSTLIIGEPGRSLRNPVFILKMSMLAAVLVLTLIFHRGLRHNDRFWENSPGRRIGGRLIAALSLVIWVGIVFAGRWIAYIDVNST